MLSFHILEGGAGIPPSSTVVRYAPTVVDVDGLRRLVLTGWARFTHPSREVALSHAKAAQSLTSRELWEADFGLDPRMEIRPVLCWGIDGAPVYPGQVIAP